MPVIRPYSTTLPECTLLWMWWIWTYSSGLSTLNTTLRYTCISSQTKITYQAPHQIDFSPPSPGQIQTQQIKVAVPPTVTMIPKEAIPGHIIETVDVSIGVLHNALTPVLTVPAMTPHITEHLHTGAHQLTLGTRAWQKKSKSHDRWSTNGFLDPTPLSKRSTSHSYQRSITQQKHWQSQNPFSI